MIKLIEEVINLVLVVTVIGVIVSMLGIKL
jgi:hypothetical protein